MNWMHALRLGRFLFWARSRRENTKGLELGVEYRFRPGCSKHYQFREFTVLIAYNKSWQEIS